jgi:hypothetical protein
MYMWSQVEQVITLKKDLKQDILVFNLYYLSTIEKIKNIVFKM